MADELEHLIERIQTEAVATGEREAARLVAEARAQAEALLRDAQREADARLKNADDEARQFEERSLQTLRHAARDLLISVGQGVEAMLSRIVQSDVEKALDPDTLRAMLVKASEAYAGQGAKSGPPAFLLSPADREALEAFFRARLAGELQQGLALESDGRIFKGFQVLLEGGRVRHQFTAEAIAEDLGGYLRPRLSAIVHEVARETGGARA